MKRCKSCDSDLSSKSEISTMTCTTCMIRAAGDLEVVAAERDELRQKYEGIKKVGELVEIESKARGAAQRGCSIDDNPYEEPSEEHTMWQNGWLSEHALMCLSELCSVCLWVIDSLDVVKEIARASGNEEVVMKLDTISQKLQEHLEDK